jgi:uncharacterized membrane protein/protein-disulfide isomerase
VKDNEATPSTHGLPWWRWSIAGLSAFGLILSVYLGWHYLAGGSLIGCGGGSPCDEILGSRWSVVGGVLPVSGLAAGVYLAILVASFFIGPGSEPTVRQLAWRALLILAATVAGSAVWFTIVQKWMVGAFCPYCMATHTTGLLLAALILWRGWRESADDWAALGSAQIPASKPNTDGAPAFSPRRANRRTIFAWPAIGLGLAAGLAICQFAFNPPSRSHGGESQAAEATAFDPRAVPLLGSPNASYVVDVLFDYNCPHCQQLHGMLEEAVGRYQGKLAFVLCPAPLNTACNPYVTGDAAAFKDSCELAWLGLSVWVANREAFAEFDRWMFAAEAGRLWRPRKFDAALAKAIELIGRPKFEAAQRDPWIERYLQTSVRLYGTSGAGAVPKLVYGARWMTPQPRNADDLMQILQKSLNVPAP